MRWSRPAGLEPGGRVAIRPELADARARLTSQADLVADSSSGVDLSKQARLAGSYNLNPA
jgi:Acyl-CoA thioester hydrolase/BAAT N-terminal region